MFHSLRPFLLSATLLVGATSLSAAEGTDNAALKAEIEQVLEKSQLWLAAQQQPNGAFAPGAKFALGITGMAVDALQSAPAYLPKGGKEVDLALKFLWDHQQTNGGVYTEDEGLGNYNTSLALMAMATTDRLEAERTKRMQDYLFGSQNVDPKSVAFGGMGYGSRGEGNEDLSNTGFAIEALRRSGVPASDPHLQRALEFLEHCQDLSSHNDKPWAGNSGGGVYSPDESKAGGSWNPESNEPTPKLEPYGSMTYQLISSYIALDLKPGDPRLDAAYKWVTANYVFDRNPGMPEGKQQQGLLYYYMTMAKTFDLLNVTEVETATGKHDWRRDLFEAIKSRAAKANLPDGSECLIWINSADRWAEGMPHVTGPYLIRALKRIHQSL